MWGREGRVEVGMTKEAAGSQYGWTKVSDGKDAKR